MMRKLVWVSLRLPVKTKIKLERMAKAKDNTLSGIVRELLDQKLDGKK
jgi:predicted DNA-binding protein